MVCSSLPLMWSSMWRRRALAVSWKGSITASCTSPLLLVVVGNASDWKLTIDDPSRFSNTNSKIASPAGNSSSTSNAPWISMSRKDISNLSCGESCPVTKRHSRKAMAWPSSANTSLSFFFTTIGDSLGYALQMRRRWSKRNGLITPSSAASPPSAGRNARPCPLPPAALPAHTTAAAGHARAARARLPSAKCHIDRDELALRALPAEGGEVVVSRAAIET
mmetsp:Transcript_124362/g.264998  ORF Transcript_124362/g.264998 Transcript_124362/m.264998 type:complete len:221 (-) Transcript_124362:8-670(-)